MPTIHRHQRTLPPYRLPQITTRDIRKHVVLLINGKPAITFPNQEDAERWAYEHRAELLGATLSIIAAEVALSDPAMASTIERLILSSLGVGVAYGYSNYILKRMKRHA